MTDMNVEDADSRSFEWRGLTEREVVQYVAVPLMVAAIGAVGVVAAALVTAGFFG